MAVKNHMKLQFWSKSQNEVFARVTVASFASQLDPTIEELADIKTAVSEAVTNSVIHGYMGGLGMIFIECNIIDNEIEIFIKDEGRGIEDVAQAMQPLYTSKPELERSGMGFTIMETFMDEVEVESQKDSGTIVRLVKRFKKDGD